MPRDYSSPAFPVADGEHRERFGQSRHAVAEMAVLDGGILGIAGNELHRPKRRARPVVFPDQFSHFPAAGQERKIGLWGKAGHKMGTLPDYTG